MSVTRIIDLVAEHSGKTSKQALADPQLRNVITACVIFDGLSREDQNAYIAYLCGLREGKSK